MRRSRRRTGCRPESSRRARSAGSCRGDRPGSAGSTTRCRRLRRRPRARRRRSRTACRRDRTRGGRPCDSSRVPTGSVTSVVSSLRLARAVGEAHDDLGREVVAGVRSRTRSGRTRTSGSARGRAGRARCSRRRAAVGTRANSVTDPSRAILIVPSRSAKKSRPSGAHASAVAKSASATNVLSPVGPADLDRRHRARVGAVGRGAPWWSAPRSSCRSWRSKRRTRCGRSRGVSRRRHCSAASTTASTTSKVTCRRRCLTQAEAMRRCSAGVAGRPGRRSGIDPSRYGAGWRSRAGGAAMVEKRAPPLETLVTGLDFGEGPRWHDGRLWYSDFYQHRVSRGDGRRRRGETMLEIDDQPSGLGWLPDGRMLVVSMLKRKVLRVEHDGSVVVHADLSSIATGALQRHGRRRRRQRLRRQLRLRDRSGPRAAYRRPRARPPRRHGRGGGRGDAVPERQRHHAGRSHARRRGVDGAALHRVRHRRRRHAEQPTRVGGAR